MAEVRNYYDKLPDSLQNEKRALLAQMAEKGSEAQAYYENMGKNLKRIRGNSLEGAAARGAAIGAGPDLQTKLRQNYDALLGVFGANNRRAALSHGREMDRLSAANAAYLDQASAAGLNLQRILDAQIEQARLAATARASGGGGDGGGYSGLLGSGPTEDPERLGIMEAVIAAANTGFLRSSYNADALRQEMVAMGYDPVKVDEALAASGGARMGGLSWDLNKIVNSMPSDRVDATSSLPTAGQIKSHADRTADAKADAYAEMLRQAAARRNMTGPVRYF